MYIVHPSVLMFAIMFITFFVFFSSLFKSASYSPPTDFLQAAYTAKKVCKFDVQKSFLLYYDQRRPFVLQIFINRPAYLSLFENALHTTLFLFQNYNKRKA